MTKAILILTAAAALTGCGAPGTQEPEAAPEAGPYRLQQTIKEGQTVFRAR